MIEIDHHRAIDLLRGVVAGNEDFIYEKRANELGKKSRCVYIYNGSPDCLIGRALHDAGVPNDVLLDLNGCGGIVLQDSLTTLQNAGFFLTATATNIFQIAQESQDNGRTWGDSLTLAEGTYSSALEIFNAFV